MPPTSGRKETVTEAGGRATTTPTAPPRPADYLKPPRPNDGNVLAERMFYLPTQQQPSGRVARGRNDPAKSLCALTGPASSSVPRPALFCLLVLFRVLLSTRPPACPMALFLAILDTSLDADDDGRGTTRGRRRLAKNGNVVGSVAADETNDLNAQKKRKKKFAFRSVPTPTHSRPGHTGTRQRTKQLGHGCRGPNHNLPRNWTGKRTFSA